MKPNMEIITHSVFPMDSSSIDKELNGTFNSKITMSAKERIAIAALCAVVKIY